MGMLRRNLWDVNGNENSLGVTKRGKKSTIWEIKKKIWKNYSYFYDQILNLPPMGKSCKKKPKEPLFLNIL